jgi:hypothetical protein
VTLRRRAGASINLLTVDVSRICPLRQFEASTLHFGPKMNGGRSPNPGYVAARRVLLDALRALAAHRKAVVLVGAQAVHLHAGDGDLAVAPYTTDGDLAIDPRELDDEPALATTSQDARTYLGALFGDRDAPDAQIVARATVGLEDEIAIRLSCAALARQLLGAWQP